MDAVAGPRGPALGVALTARETVGSCAMWTVVASLGSLAATTGSGAGRPPAGVSDRASRRFVAAARGRVLARVRARTGLPAPTGAGVALASLGDGRRFCGVRRCRRCRRRRLGRCPVVEGACCSPAGAVLVPSPASAIGASSFVAGSCSSAPVSSSSGSAATGAPGAGPASNGRSVDSPPGSKSGSAAGSLTAAWSGAAEPSCSWSGSWARAAVGGADDSASTPAASRAWVRRLTSASAGSVPASRSSRHTGHSGWKASAPWSPASA